VSDFILLLLVGAWSGVVALPRDGFLLKIGVSLPEYGVCSPEGGISLPEVGVS
jgi:hypothetical protein